MLRRLKIENLAIIESGELEFGSGLSVLTGETGAGKSLVVSAVELLLGERADTSRLRTGAEEAIIEGVFERGGEEVELRRRITSSGRSYGWVDGTPVSMGELSDAARNFADLLGQHEHQVLLDSESHLDFLDEFADIDDKAANYRKLFEEFGELRAQKKRLEQRIESAEEKNRLREFEYRELGEAELDAGEWEEVRSSMARLESAERIVSAAGTALENLTEGESSAASLMAEAEREFEGIGEVVSEAKEALSLLDTAHAAVSEASNLADTILRSVDIDPEEAEEIRNRYDLYRRLQRKYARDVEGLLDYLGELERGAENIEELRLESKKIARSIAELRNNLITEARDLSRLREDAAPRLSEAIRRELRPLGMDGVRFAVRFLREPGEDVDIVGESCRLLPTGAERAEFMISPNPGEDLRPLASIVSGGELSRIMLAFKSISGGEGDADFLIFDEVDTGIGGKVGIAVGKALSELASRVQILVITHLPQIARFADAHYAIEKYERGGRTRVDLRRLDPEGIMEEIARMKGEEVKFANGG